MSRTAYVNGRYLPLADAAVHVEDRGLQFADGVYEVLYVREGVPLDAGLHLARLERSLRELRLAQPVPRASLEAVVGEIIRRNRLRHGLVYIQVTRGTAPRLHVFPKAGTRPTLIVTGRRAAPMPPDLEHWTARAITLPDERWARCDIKSVSLLPNVLAKQAAKEAGAIEAILYDRDGMVTEGASTSVWIVDRAGRLRTRALGPEILPGCTRAALIEEMEKSQIGFEERAFAVEELRGAREIFLTAATTFVKPVTELDGIRVGDGRAGPVASRLFALFAARA